MSNTLMYNGRTMALDVKPALPTAASRFPACPVCQNARVHTRLSAVSDYLTGECFDIGRCQECGLLISEALHPSARLADYYGPRYRGDRHSVTARYRTARRRSMVRRAVPFGYRGRLLDIGCGNGDFIRAMKADGWTVAGTELDDAVVSRLQSEGIEARVAGGETPIAFSQPFDVITCWHVLEHMDDLRGLLQQVQRLLSPDGVFQASVPDAGSWHARLCGKGWLHYDVPRHRVHFAEPQFQHLLRSEGFEIVHSHHRAFEYDWFGLAQGLMNRVSTWPNVLFDLLTQRQFAPQASVADRAMAVALGPLVCAAVLPAVAAHAAIGGGATLTLTCRATPASGGSRTTVP